MKASTTVQGKTRLVRLGQGCTGVRCWARRGQGLAPRRTATVRREAHHLHRRDHAGMAKAWDLPYLVQKVLSPG